MATIELPTLLSLDEVAERLNISRVSAWRLVRSRRLKAFRVGNLIRVDERELHRYLFEGEAE